MKYFVNESERKTSHSSCYLEFQRGAYRDACWLQDSISISDDLWDRCHLSALFHSAVEDFDYYGITAVTKIQWDKIVEDSQKSGSPWSEIIAETASWVNSCFDEYEIFTIIGM